MTSREQLVGFVPAEPVGFKQKNGVPGRPRSHRCGYSKKLYQTGPGPLGGIAGEFCMSIFRKCWTPVYITQFMCKLLQLGLPTGVLAYSVYRWPWGGQPGSPPVAPWWPMPPLGPFGALPRGPRVLKIRPPPPKHHQTYFRPLLPLRHTIFDPWVPSNNRFSMFSFSEKSSIFFKHMF